VKAVKGKGTNDGCCLISFFKLDKVANYTHTIEKLSVVVEVVDTSALGIIYQENQ
jgi:hypothetical protein